MKILILEPYLAGSHKAWVEGFSKYSEHEVEILSLPGNFWKWRMHGGAVTLARQFLESNSRPDLLFTTDMLDLTSFLALTRVRTASMPSVTYFHENQLTYPWSEKDRDVRKNRDRHYGFINFVSALGANAVVFNSKYHLNSFLVELPRFLRNFPDQQELEAVDKIRAKSRILPLGLELARLDRAKVRLSRSQSQERKPLVLWNHRWEYDKNPEEFFQALFVLAEKDLDFEVAILGECFSEQPQAFTAAREKLGERVVQFGFVEDATEYASWLWRSDIVPVTSHQDFFGASVVEAIYCNSFPILPKRLAYPELIPIELHENYFYTNFEDLVNRLEAAILSVRALQEKTVRRFAGQFCWTKMASKYDDFLVHVAEVTKVDS